MTRQDAIKNKETFYEGRVCKRGHGNIRYVNGGSCVKCVSEYCKGNGYLSQKKIYYSNNKETILQKVKFYYELNKTERLEYLKNWQKRNRYKTTMYTNTRRAKVLNQTPHDADTSIIECIYKECENRTRTTGVTYHVDHIIPLSRGGRHHQDNLQIITATENLIKGSKIV